MKVRGAYRRRSKGRARPAPWPCVGCGRPQAKFRWTYCKRCRLRVEDGIPLDIDDIPTQAECYSAIVRMSAFFSSR